MLVTVLVMFPIIGSLWVMLSGICKSVETQRSVTTEIGLALPIWPAGIVRVTRVPWADRPRMLLVPPGPVETWARPRSQGGPRWGWGAAWADAAASHARSSSVD